MVERKHQTAFSVKKKSRASGERRTRSKQYDDLAMQEGILLFCLKGEIQKLGTTHLVAEQKAALDAVCGKMDRAAKLAKNTADDENGNEIARLLHESYDSVKEEAGKLGMYGSVIAYLAEEVNKPLQYLLE